MAMVDPSLRPVISAKNGSGATRSIKSHHNVSGFVLKRRYFHGAQAWVRAIGDGRRSCFSGHRRRESFPEKDLRKEAGSG